MAETRDILAIDRKRRELKLPVTALCRQAGIGRQTYDDMMHRRYEPRDVTMRRLRQALQRYELSFGGGDLGPMSTHAAYKATLVLAAFTLKIDARRALAAEPGKRANASEEWRDSAAARWVAFNVMVGLLGFKQADVARAAGVTKQAVNNALSELAERRDSDPAIDRVMGELEEIFA